MLLVRGYPNSKSASTATAISARYQTAKATFFTRGDIAPPHSRECRFAYKFIACEKIKEIKQNGQNPTRDGSASILEQMYEVADDLVNTIQYIKTVSDKNFELISSLKQKYGVDYLELNCENRDGLVLTKSSVTVLLSA